MAAVSPAGPAPMMIAVPCFIPSLCESYSRVRHT
jgi:hypothetical protein